MIRKISTYESYSEGFDDIVSELRRASKLKYSTSLAFTVTFSNPPPYMGTQTVGQEKEVQLFRDRGIRLSLFEEKVREMGGLMPTLLYYVERRTGVTGWGRITRIEMHMFRTP